MAVENVSLEIDRIKSVRKTAAKENTVRKKVNSYNGTYFKTDCNKKRFLGEMLL